MRAQGRATRSCQGVRGALSERLPCAHQKGARLSRASAPAAGHTSIIIMHHNTVSSRGHVRCDMSRVLDHWSLPQNSDGRHAASDQAEQTVRPGMPASRHTSPAHLRRRRNPESRDAALRSHGATGTESSESKATWAAGPLPVILPFVAVARRGPPPLMLLPLVLYIYYNCC